MKTKEGRRRRREEEFLKRNKPRKWPLMTRKEEGKRLAVNTTTEKEKNQSGEEEGVN
jgi:hypothetical protein